MAGNAVLLVLLLLFAGAGLCRGDTWSSPQAVADGLAGHGDLSVVVREWRLPRVVAAGLFGALLGCAGAVFQNLTRNELGSPDVIGLDVGSYTGALVVMVVIGGTTTPTALGSVVGGLLTAVVVLTLSTRSGFGGHRLIVIGIAVYAMLTAVNSWIILRADLDVAIAAEMWNVGSLNGVDWADLNVAFVAAAILAVLLFLNSRATQQAALGDPIAVTSGVRLRRHRLAAVVAGAGCTATVTAITGPIAFVALAAPHLGRAATRSPGIHFVPAALTGSVLLLSADLIAQSLLAPVTLPVGVVTTAIGGAYLLLLLLKEVKRP
ncbi:iron chelate uptake ABC transporter family permease subunit [Embleya sp. NBC_00888]|uniref:FecCD family ABC transporter permease n=1 Tax=Embleya sp. NBC_00888 TaxID=2975960 RepID=UPI00386EA605|nr:iron chelate uptake ABC transporter family permease subunit [Embleya sp. NBC_00888]